MGIETTLPPSVEASRMETLQGLWATAGLEDVKARTITVQRRFDSAQETQVPEQGPYNPRSIGWRPMRAPS